MATRAGAFLLGCTGGYTIYWYTNRELHSRTSIIERSIADIGYSIYTMRAATGVDEAAGGIILPKQQPQPLHPKPYIPPSSDIYYDALYSTVIHKWNNLIRHTHNTIMRFIIEQQNNTTQATTDKQQHQQ